MSRVLPFKRVHNFRDLGGYRTSSGRSVRWNRLYRSGHLAKMRGADLARFQALNIHTIIDFRSIKERTKEPTRLPPSFGANIVSLPMRDPASSRMDKEVRARLRSGDLDRFDAHNNMVQMYQGLAQECTEQYRDFVSTVLQTQGQPVLWHCTAGKDRAGFAAAILLRLLGVPQETVVEDYMLSADYADRRQFAMFLLQLFRGRKGASVIQPLLTVQREWIEASFEAIDDRWGSFDQYSAQALALSPGDIVQLRRLLLDTA